MLSIFALLLGLAQINQPFPEVAPLHHIPTATLLLSAPFLLRSWPLTNGAVICIIAFFLLHTLGGRYTYTNVPYDIWFQTVLGFDLSSAFVWERNHYDRLVHFSFGAFSVYPVYQILRRYAFVTKSLAVYVSIEFVMGISAVYEIVEWLLSLLLAGDALESYNGQQGDIWDAQKDMGLALLGALLTGIFLVFKKPAEDFELPESDDAN